MKTTISIDIEKDLLNQAEDYAKQHQLSVSELVELYFRNLSAPSNKNIIQLIEQLEKPHFDENMDLKKSFYEDQKAKYGF